MRWFGRRRKWYANWGKIISYYPTPLQNSWIKYFTLWKSRWKNLFFFYVYFKKMRRSTNDQNYFKRKNCKTRVFYHIKQLISLDKLNIIWCKKVIRTITIKGGKSTMSCCWKYYWCFVWRRKWLKQNIQVFIKIKKGVFLSNWTGCW